MSLTESPFEGEWMGLSWDWAETLPCSAAELDLTRELRRWQPWGVSSLASEILSDHAARVWMGACRRL